MLILQYQILSRRSLVVTIQIYEALIQGTHMPIYYILMDHHAPHTHLIWEKLQKKEKKCKTNLTYPNLRSGFFVCPFVL